MKWFSSIFCASILVLALPKQVGAQSSEETWFTITPILDLVGGFQYDDEATAPLSPDEGVLRGALGEYRGNPEPGRETLGLYIGSLELDLAARVQESVKLRADVNFGRDEDGIGGAGNVSLEQAFATLYTGLGKGLELTVGRVNDPTGIEGEDRFDNPAIAFTWVTRMTADNVTGIGLSYPLSQNLNAQINAVNNLNDSIEGDSPMPTLQAIVAGEWERGGESIEFGVGVNAGLETPGNDDEWTYLGNAYVRFPIGSSLRCDLEGILVQVDGFGDQWTRILGGYAYVSLAIGESSSAYMRYGFYDDNDDEGRFSGADQQIHQGTAGMRFDIDDTLFTRAEYSVDIHQPDDLDTSLSHAVLFQLVYLGKAWPLGAHGN